MGTYRLTTLVMAPPDRVFDLWTNLDRMKEWVGGVTKVTNVTGPITEPGTRYTVWFGGMKSQTEVIEVERPWRYRTRFGNWLLRGENSTTFEAEGAGTRVVEEFQSEGFVPGLMARIFATGSFRGSFQGELNAFAKIAEGDAAAA